MMFLKKHLYWVMIATVSLVLYGLFKWLMPFLPEKLVVHNPGQIVLFFALFSGITHLLFSRMVHKKPQRFVTYYMGLVSFKLFSLLAILLVYAVTHRSEAPAFILAFFICYLVFSVFDTFILVKNASKSGSNT